LLRIRRPKKEAKKDKKGKKDKKDKKKKEDEDSDKDKKKKKDKKKESKSKKEKKEDKENDSQSYIKDALFGKEEDDVSSDPDSTSVVSEAGVDDDAALNIAIEETRKYLEANPKASAVDIIELVTNQQMASALKTHDKVQILARAAFTSHFFKNKEIGKYAPVFAKLANGNKITQRHLISALEFICMEKPKNFPVMIKQLYDEDALDEEVILEWAEDGRSDYTYDAVNEETRASLRGEAEPVIVWLQEADSEDESDEEE